MKEFFIMRLFFLFSFICVVFFAGCERKTTLKIYCDELFWSVLWEESAQFQRLYGKQVELLYNYPVDQNAETNNTDTDTDTEPAKKSYVPAPWRNMPKNENNKENKNKTATITLDNNITKIIFDLHETLPGDMYLTESNLQLTLLKEQLLVSREYPFCYLTMVLLVPKGNPLFIESVRDTMDRQLRLGIVEPSITGMGNAAWDIVTKINENKTTKNNNNSNEQIKIFNSIKNLLEALEQNQIDAALTWDACARRAEKYAEVVQLGKKKINNTNNPKTPNNTSTPEQENNTTKNNNTNNNEIDTNSEHRLLRVSIISLTIAEKEPHCRRFADFLISKEGQRILQRHGFVPTGK